MAITVSKLVFTKEMLELLPDCQRAVLVYAGHISNELNWLNKLTLIIQQTGNNVAKKLPGPLSSEDRATMDGNATQAFIHTRIFAGKIHEAIQFLERWCFGMPWFEDACKEMESEGKEALLSIQKYLDDIRNGRKANLMRLVRNKFGFHYDDKAVKASIRVTDLVEDFVTYMHPKVGNTLYLGSEFAITGYLIESAKQGDAKSTIDALMGDTTELSQQINRLLGHTLSHLYTKYFGSDLQSLGLVEEIPIKTLPMEDVLLPFFSNPPVNDEVDEN